MPVNLNYILSCRIIVGSWLVLSLIFSSSYGGNLRAFLMTPRFEQAVENMKDVINSDLSWSMVTYGEEVETYLENSEDPVEQAFWNGRTIIDFAEFPYDAVSFE